MANLRFFNRDISWLAFNHRVLQEARDLSVPLYERIKFLAIFSSNLDEFFRVRISALRYFKRLPREQRKALLDFKPKKNFGKSWTSSTPTKSNWALFFATKSSPNSGNTVSFC
ncbi:MAG: hypothetical protein IPH94_19710 [Saprospiraceae bacterium]|nr:hypothetical protein [Saprospiraceae bacterium]